MKQKDILKLKEIIVKSLGAEDIVVDDEFSLLDAGFNSISFIKLVLFVENYFSIEFADDDLSIFAFPSIKELIDYIDNRVDKM